MSRAVVVPSTRRPNRALLVTSVAVAAAAFYALGPRGADPDLFWHLRVAELIRTNGPGPIFDSFSYNSVGEPWLPYSWLSELIIEWLVTVLGTTALFAVPLVCYLATLFFAALTVANRETRGLKAAVVLGVIALLLVPFLALRPATLVFPMCAYAVWAVTGARRRRRWLAALTLVPLTALMANMHLYFLFPPLLLLVWGMGTWVQGRENRGQFFLTVAALALAAGILANPFKLDMLRVVAHYLLDDVMVREAAIIEMLPFYRLGPLVLGGTALLLLWSFAGLLGRGFRANPREAVVFAVAIVLVLSHGRYVPLAALLMAPVAATYAPWPKFSPAAAYRLSGVALGMVLGLAVSGAQNLANHPPSASLDHYLESSTSYPVAAARFVRDSVPRRTGRLVNEMGWGGYLIYALWPRYQVMMDGRTQVYPETLWRDAYLNATPASRAELIRRSRADAAVLPLGSSWARLLDGLGWHRVYSDHLAGVWIDAAAPAASPTPPAGDRTGDPGHGTQSLTALDASGTRP